MDYIRRTERCDDEANWIASDPILAAGEIGVAECHFGDVSVMRMKVGDGSSKWTELKYQDELYAYIQTLNKE